MKFTKIVIVLLAVVFAFSCAVDSMDELNGASDRSASAVSSVSQSLAASDNSDVFDIGTMLRYQEGLTENRAAIDAQVKALASAVDFDEDDGDEDSDDESGFTYNGGTKFYLGYDSLYGYYFKTYTLRAVGESVEIWVADDLSFDDEREAQVVSQEQVDMLCAEIDSNIYPVDTAFFGTPESHSGDESLLVDWGYFDEGYYNSDDGVERLIVLADNVRDDQFYDPEYPFFIAGFYSPTFEAYFDRNIINLDTKSWAERLENTYYGVTAHEFQHLIHDDNDPTEETWLNEGMSDFAEYLCGYGHPESHVEFFLEHPENSLIEWDEHEDADTGPETLADYGQAYLLQLYLYDQYGQNFTQTLATSPVSGFDGVNQALADFGTGIDFEELFRRFCIAVAIDTDAVGGGIYNFDSIDISIDFESALEYDKDGVPAWGGDYKEFEDAQKIHNIDFDGALVLPTPWMVVEDPLGGEGSVFWGNAGHELANGMVLSVDLTGLDSATLAFDNYILIEEQWDFGIVQVSADGGQTWTSLANENTRDDIVDEGYPDIMENLPGFTGYYDDWTAEIFDLSAYAGQEIMINFNYMTDWGYNDPGWYIDNIEIPEIGYYNDGESLDDFISYDAAVGNKVEYGVSFINKKSLGKGKNNSKYSVLSVDLFSIDEKEAEVLKGFFSGGENYAVIWYASADGAKGTVPYEYDIMTKKEFAQAEKKKK